VHAKKVESNRLGDVPNSRGHYERRNVPAQAAPNRKTMNGPVWDSLRIRFAPSKDQLDLNSKPPEPGKQFALVRFSA